MSDIRMNVQDEPQAMEVTMQSIMACDLDAELAAILTPDSTALVDFDHTLFACNSTELFIATCRPACVVAVVDAILLHLVPWRRLAGPQWFRARDLVRCLALIVMCPWSLPLWTRSAPGLWRRHSSGAVCKALNRIDPSRTVIVTFGMGAIVRPLLRASQWRDSLLIATPLLPPAGYLRHAKLPLVLAACGSQVVASSVFVTDSLDDSDLLVAAEHGLLLERQGEAFNAKERVYLPLRYTARAKYTLSYMLDQLVLVDMLLLVLCSAGPLETLLWRALVIACLVLSLMCVYEIGYYENDTVAARSEVAPTLSGQVAKFRSFPIQPAAWMWALTAAAAGALVSVYTGVVAFSGLAPMLVWVGALVLLRLLFMAYNRSPLHQRVVLYPFLQLMKYVPVLALVHATAFGAVLVACQVATMWVTYLIYRLGGDKAQFLREEFRTILFVVATILLLTSLPVSELGGWTPLALMLVWSAARLSKAKVLDFARRRRQASVRA